MCYDKKGFNQPVKQVARASQSCDQEFNVALRKNYRNIFPLIFQLETADFVNFSQNFRKIFALISPLETADFCQIIDGIITRVPYISCSIAA